MQFITKIEAIWFNLAQNLGQLGLHGSQEPLLRIPTDNDPSSLVRFGPLLGPSWGLSWAYVAPRVVKKRFKTHLENMLFPNISFLAKLGLPGPPWDTKNIAKQPYCHQKSRFSAFQQKLLWGGILGHFSEGFWSPSWSQEAQSWVHVAKKT